MTQAEGAGSGEPCRRLIDNVKLALAALPTPFRSTLQVEGLQATDPLRADGIFSPTVMEAPSMVADRPQFIARRIYKTVE